MKSDEIGTTLKHPETINGNVKSLSKGIEKKGKENADSILITSNYEGACPCVTLKMTTKNSKIAL